MAVFAFLIAMVCVLYLIASLAPTNSFLLLPLEKKPPGDVKHIAKEQEIPVQLGMRILVSLLAMAGILRVILSGKYKTAEKHWAYGMMGTIIGYWFRGG